MRSIYEIREQPSRMYAWSALVTSQLMVEIPLNIVNSSIFFLCWYWTVGFDTNRGAYTYLFLSFLMPLVRPSSFLAFHSRLIVSCLLTVLCVLLFPLRSSSIYVNGIHLQTPLSQQPLLPWAPTLRLQEFSFLSSSRSCSHCESIGRFPFGGYTYLTLISIAMVFYSHIHSSIGGDGCII